MEILRRRLSHFCACHPCGSMEIFARRIKLTRATKENLRLKILEVKGASCVGDPCNSIKGPHLASPASPRTSQWQKPSCSHLGSITWTVWPSGLSRTDREAGTQRERERETADSWLAKQTDRQQTSPHLHILPNLTSYIFTS